jgi:DNA processing protein
MRENQVRLALFAAIEGGHVFWSQEIATYGSDHVYKKLIEGGYDGVKFGKTIDRLRAVNVKEIAKSIDSAGARSS